MADRTVVYRLIADATQFRAGMAQASQSTDQLGTQTQRSAGRGAAAMDALGVSALGAAAAVGGKVILSAANFEQAMSNVQAATMESSDNMERLKDAALEAGQATAFSATEAAAGIENLAKAGVSTEDILSGGLTGALDLAAAGGLDVATSAEIAATALTQFKLAGEDVPHVADLLAAGAGKAQGDVTDLAMALKQSGLVAAQMGIDIEETTGTLAAFASAGLLGSDAGTSFRTMLLRLANPTKESADLMAELGINAYDAQGSFVGMASVSAQLQKAFEGKTQAERDSAMATLFGSDAIRAANVLYNEGQAGIEGWTAAVDDSGYAAEQAAIRMDNLKGKWEEFTGALETAMIQQGGGSMGPLATLLEGGTAAVSMFGELQSSTSWWGEALMGLINGPVVLLGNAISDIANTPFGQWIADKFGQGEEAAKKTEEATESATSATKGFEGATDGATDSLQAAAEAAQDYNDHLKSLHATLTARSDVRDYKAALDEFTASIKENGRSFDINTNKGRANMQALDNIAGSALRVAASMDEASRKKFLTQAIRDIRQMGGEVDAPKKDIRELIGLLREAEKTPASPEVSVPGAAGAIAQVQTLTQQIRAINGMTSTAYVNVIRRGQRTGVNPLDPYGSYASGGFTGAGGKYEPAGVVHRGEVVIPQELVRRDWSLLSSRYGHLPGFASGGLAGSGSDDRVRANIDERMEILRLRRELRQLTKALNKDGKDRLKGLARQEAILQRQAARRDLRQARNAPEERAAERRREREEQLLEKRIAMLEGERDVAQSLREAAEKQQQAAESQRDAIKAQYDNAKSGVTSNILSGDIFAGGTLASFDRSLRKQAADSTAFESTLQTLMGMGLDGALLEEASSRGDLKFLQQLVGVGAGGIEEYEQLYARTTATAARTGDSVADRLYGAQLQASEKALAEQTAVLRAQEQRLANIEAAIEAAPERQGAATGRAINGVSDTAVRNSRARGAKPKRAGGGPTRR